MARATVADPFDSAMRALGPEWQIVALAASFDRDYTKTRTLITIVVKSNRPDLSFFASLARKSQFALFGKHINKIEPEGTNVQTPASFRPGIEDIIQGFQRFQEDFEEDKSFYKHLAEGQHPQILWIGCSDSRVVPEIITDSEPGTLFVVRNMANLVPPEGSPESSVAAAIEYAVRHLKVGDIVVCGHSDCGGVKAMQSAFTDGNNWLKQWIGHGHAPVEAGTSDAVKANIQAQCDNVMSYGFVAEGVQAGRLGVHGWFYDMEEGDLLAFDRNAQIWKSLGYRQHS